MTILKSSRRVKANLHAAICRADLSATTKSKSESARVNGDPMRTRLQSDKSADSEKSVTASQIFACRDRF